jgi:hypothetical protein
MKEIREQIYTADTYHYIHMVNLLYQQPCKVVFHQLNLLFESSLSGSNGCLFGQPLKIEDTYKNKNNLHILNNMVTKTYIRHLILIHLYRHITN